MQSRSVDRSGPTALREQVDGFFESVHHSLSNGQLISQFRRLEHPKKEVLCGPCQMTILGALGLHR